MVMLNVAKNFPIEVAVSVRTGIMCCDEFSKVHECIEWVAGHPVWTHEMGRGSFMEKIKELVKEQSDNNFVGVTKENALEWAQKHKGEVVNICKGYNEREKDPLTTLEEMIDKPVKGEEE